MNLKIPKLILGMVFMVGILNVRAQTVPTFYPGEVLQFSDASNLTPPKLQPYPQYPQYTVENSDATPCVVDWNGDGVKDILSGYFYNGWVYYYQNTGTSISPSFINDNETLVQADGTTISVGYG